MRNATRQSWWCQQAKETQIVRSRQENVTKHLHNEGVYGRETFLQYVSISHRLLLPIDPFWDRDKLQEWKSATNYSKSFRMSDVGCNCSPVVRLSSCSSWALVAMLHFAWPLFWLTVRPSFVSEWGVCSYLVYTFRGGGSGCGKVTTFLVMIKMI